MQQQFDRLSVLMVLAKMELALIIDVCSWAGWLGRILHTNITEAQACYFGLVYMSRWLHSHTSVLNPNQSV